MTTVRNISFQNVIHRVYLWVLVSLYKTKEREKNRIQERHVLIVGVCSAKTADWKCTKAFNCDYGVCLFYIIWFLNTLVLFRCLRVYKGSKIFNYILMSQNHSQQNEINAIAKSPLYRISYINSRYVSLPQVTSAETLFTKLNHW